MLGEMGELPDIIEAALNHVVDAGVKLPKTAV